MRSVLLILAGLALLAPAWGFDLRPIPMAKPTSVGLGGGYLYGVVGGNAEFRYTPRVSLAGGIGIGGAFAGAHYYLKPAASPLRYRLTAGVSAQLFGNDDGSYDYSPVPTFGFGLTWATARTNYRGVNVDLSTRGVALGFQF
jgi:hypothetical protein